MDQSIKPVAASPVAGGASPAAERDNALYRKVAWRLLPFLMVCYIAAFLDRVNVGFAKLQMLDDLKFSEAVYGLGAGIFFIGYFLFEVPSNVLMHRIGARKTLARIMILWGLISAAMALTQTPTQFYLLRFLLGAAEAGFYPGIILYLTYWFPSSRRGQIVAVFMTAVPFAGILGGPLSGWVMEAFHQTSGLAGWRGCSSSRRFRPCCWAWRCSGTWMIASATRAGCRRRRRRG